MKIYQALNIKELYDIDEMREQGLECWLLYLTSEENGRRISLISSVEPFLNIKEVIPESLYCIWYKNGAYYQMESLMEYMGERSLNLILNKYS